MGQNINNNSVTKGSTSIVLLLAFLLCAFHAGCDLYEDIADLVDGGGDADADTDTDTDADTDSDADTDADADSDTDTDTDADADSDSDTDTDADADSDSDTDTDTDADSDSDTDTDTDTDADADADTDTDTDTDADSDTDSDSDCDTDTDTDADSDADSDTDTDTDGDGDTDSGLDTDDTDTDTGSSGGGTAFINEIHYDNQGADQDEGVEIAGSAQLDLTDWSIAFYNGGNGEVYQSIALSGVIPDLQAGFGVLWFSQEKMQNGAPDGLALVDPHGRVVQFLSYEGSFRALDGPAAGLESTDLGVAEETDTPQGHSLQLGGGGSEPTDFTWQPPAPATAGEINSGQHFDRLAVVK